MKEFIEELLKDPEVRKEYEALRSKYDKIRRMLKAKLFGSRVRDLPRGN